MKNTIKTVNKNQGDLFAPKPQSKKKPKFPPGRVLKKEVIEETEKVVGKEKLLTEKEELELKEELYLQRFIGKYHDDPSLHDDDDDDD